MLLSSDFKDIKDKNITLKRGLNKGKYCYFDLITEGKLRMISTSIWKNLLFGTKTIGNITLSALGNA